MLPRPNAFADDHRIRALAETLQMTVDEVNTAFAAYLPRDTVEAGMVEQLLILRHNLHHATRAARDPALTTLQADRLRRTVCTLVRQLERVSVRLEKRQDRPSGLLPQQYWRDQPIAPVGPYETEAAGTNSSIPDQQEMAPSTITPAEPTRRHHPDDPSADGDALYNLARMRIDADADPAQLLAIAERDAARSRARRPNRAPPDRLAA
jgi:hypothetical protein